MNLFEMNQSYHKLRFVIWTFKGVCGWASVGVRPMVDKHGWVLSLQQPLLTDPPPVKIKNCQKLPL